MNYTMTDVWTSLDRVFNYYENRMKSRVDKAERTYQALVPYMGENTPPTLKELLQAAASSTDITPTKKYSHGIYLNQKFYEQRLNEGKEAAAGGILDEIQLTYKIENYITNTLIPEAINDGRIDIHFDTVNNKRQLRIDQINIKDSVLDQSAKLDLMNLIKQSETSLTGTSRMKTLKTIKEITPGINVYDKGSIPDENGKYTNKDIELQIDMVYHYGSQETHANLDKIVVQNKKTDKYVNEPFMAVLNHKDLPELKIPYLIQQSFEQVDFFCINGRVYYNYEILQQVKDKIKTYIQAGDIVGLENFISGGK